MPTPATPAPPAPLQDPAHGLQRWKVGGAVRDTLLGLPVQDTDWVVTASTPDDMLARGFTPVGRDFPVFLHPHTREEHALARTERQSGRGYRGFTIHAAPDVPLADDLARRDLTINAIAAPPQWCGDPAQLIDPCAGLADLRRRILRHITPAFREDPVRILRIARFAARFADFDIAPETMQLMREMVQCGEMHHLVPERIWQEISRGLMQPRPSRMFQVLRECGALAAIFPELDALWGVPQCSEHHPEIDTGTHAMLVLDMAAQLTPLPQAPHHPSATQPAAQPATAQPPAQPSAAPHTPDPHPGPAPTEQPGPLAPAAIPPALILPMRFASLCHDLGKGQTPAHVLPRHIGHEQRSAQLLGAVCERWRVPQDCRELATLVAREHGNIHRSSALSPVATLRLLERSDALRRPERFAAALLACEADARGRLGHSTRPYPQRPRLLTALHAAQSVATAPIAQAVTQALAARNTPPGPAIAQAIAAARQSAIAQALGALDARHIPPPAPPPAAQV